MTIADIIIRLYSNKKPTKHYYKSNKMNKNKNKNTIGVSDEYLIEMAKELKGTKPHTEYDIMENERVKTGYYDDYKGSLRKEWESDEGKERRKVLKVSTEEHIKEVLYEWDSNTFSTIATEWNLPLGAYTDYDLRKYFKDEFLKEVGFYKKAIRGDKKIERLRKKAEENQTDLSSEIDRDKWKSIFEAIDSERRKILQPKIYKTLIEYLYNNGEDEDCIECLYPLWDLKEEGLLEKYITSEAIEAIESSEYYKSL